MHQKKPQSSTGSLLQVPGRNQVTLLCWLLALSCFGCAAGSSSLRPSELESEEGAFFGRISIVGPDSVQLTDRCQVLFTDLAGEHKAYVALDADGWVFAAARKGPTKLGNIYCRIGGGMFKTHWHYSSSALRFEVLGENAAAYFGDLVVHARYRSHRGQKIAGAMIGGAVGSALMFNADEKDARASAGSETWHRDSELFGRAKSALSSRYPSHTLEPQIAFAPPQPIHPPSRPIRTKSKVVSRRIELEGMTLYWLGVPDEEPPKVAVRLVQQVRKASLSQCKQVRFAIDGTARAYPIAHKVRLLPTAIEEVVQADTELETILQIESAQRVEVDLCGTLLELPQEALSMAGEFAQALRAKGSMEAEPGAGEVEPTERPPETVTSDLQVPTNESEDTIELAAQPPEPSASPRAVQAAASEAIGRPE